MRRLFLCVLAAALAGCASPDSNRNPPDRSAVAPAVGSAEVLDAAASRHLLVRTGFGATAADVRSLTGLTRAAAVDRLLAGARTVASSPLPPGLDVFVAPREAREGDEAQKREFLRRQAELSIAARAWWFGEMLASPSPLTERMTLFWHNHFVSSQEKVKSPVLMVRQNVLLRRHALGNFGTLLRAVARDPAMVIYLDSVQNRKGAPNENFARELMELFTLGEGHYTESDVKEAARAFTGWSLERDTGEFRFRPFAHDGGRKYVLGQGGNLDGDDVIAILLGRPETAEHVVRKLWREFVSPDPDPETVKRVAARFRNSGYDIRAAVRELLLCDAFWRDGNRGTLVKSPIDLVAGTLHTFDVQTGDLAPFVLLSASLGQNLFGPPNVKGWPGGDAWIDATTLLARKQFLDRLFRGQDRLDAMNRRPGAVLGKGAGRLGPEGRQRLLNAIGDVRFDADRWLGAFGGESAQAVSQLVLALDPLLPSAPERGGLERLRTLTQDPVYQLR